MKPLSDRWQQHLHWRVLVCQDWRDLDFPSWLTDESYRADIRHALRVVLRGET